MTRREALQSLLLKCAEFRAAYNGKFMHSREAKALFAAMDDYNNSVEPPPERVVAPVQENYKPPTKRKREPTPAPPSADASASADADTETTPNEAPESEPRQ